MRRRICPLVRILEEDGMELAERGSPLVPTELVVVGLGQLGR